MKSKQHLGFNPSRKNIIGVLLAQRLTHLDGWLTGRLVRRFGVAATVPMIPKELGLALAVANVRYLCWQLAREQNA